MLRCGTQNMDGRRDFDLRPDLRENLKDGSASLVKCKRGRKAFVRQQSAWICCGSRIPFMPILQ